MRLTLPHHTTQEEAIQKIDDHINEAMEQEYSGITVIDPEKKWDDHIMRFSFTVQKLLFTLDFSGSVIVTDAEVVGEAEIPSIVTTFVSEERIKQVIKEKFNEIFNIN